jgi:predicted ATP-binding protein involved in virulence
MRLAAIYIKDHFLFDEPQTINLGGKNLYIFEPLSNNEIKITPSVNPDFIDGFWGDNISLISAIVGENGTGKTSLLKELIMSKDKLRDKTFLNNITCVYELNDKDFVVFSNFEHNYEKVKNPERIVFQYYNPVLDYDFENIMSYINPSNFFEGSLEEYHLKILEYQIIFNYSIVSTQLKKIHLKDFPRFGSVLIKSRLHYKMDFKKTFALSNLQDVMSEFLEEVFKKYPNTNKSYEQYLHDQTSFIKNIEVSILVILVLEITHAVIKGLGNPKYTISQILEGNDFIEILKKFKEQYIYSNLDKDTFAKYENLTIAEFIIYIESSDDKVVPHKNTIKIILESFEIFEDFYKELLIIDTKNGFEMVKENLFFSNSSNDEKITNSIVNFIKLYRTLVNKLNRLNVKNNSLLEFSFFDKANDSKLRLSSGEKALLNLYSIIYNYSLNSEIIFHSWENFIFLLDEADLGFHPEWKKKFINSIIKVIPSLIADIKTLKSIQIIFTTHDPLTLSDIPNSNIVYLKKNNNNKTEVLKDNKRPTKSFGANITDLLADSFFINDGLIGDFAKGKINDLIQWLNDEKRDLSKKLESKQIIEIIDEPLMKNKLLEMYYNIFKNENDLEKEKNEVRKRAIELGIIKEND